MGTFTDPSSEAQYFRRRQVTAYTHEYSITLLLPILAAGVPVSSALATLQIMEDADFEITHLTGSATSPVNADGTRLIQATSDQLLTFAMAGSPNRSERGTRFAISEPETNRPLTRGRGTQDSVALAAQGLTTQQHYSYLSFNDVFMPGFDFVWGRPIPFHYVLPKNKRLQVQFQCTEQGPYNGYQRVSMAFIGQRYAGQ